MAGAFDAKVDISTKEATDGLRALRKEVKDTSTNLVELDKILHQTNGKLKETAAAFTEMIAAQRAAASASKEMAQAQIAEARAMGITNTAAAKQEELQARAANQTAQAGRATAQAGLASARTAESETRRTIATDRATAATQRAAQSQLELHDNLSNSRYLMYDVGQTYTVLAAGLMAIPAATAAVAAAYQRDFAQVLRVTEDLDQLPGGAQGLKDSLKAMTTDMPIAFDELSRITQLGAQMGVANDKLVAFTETTAKFVAVTGISADTGATLFGRMESSFSDDVAQYPDYFERLGSSIAYVGAKTVATDPEIASMLSQIGPLGAAAGMSSANITGLAAALASVRVQPELARGTLTRVFGQLNRDVAEGSPRMAEFGKLMNLTGDQAANLWKTDSSQFFTRMMEGLSKVQAKNGELTTTLDDLGIKASRDVSALTKLAVGYDVLDLSMKSANKGFEEGTALNDMSKVTFDTVIAKLTEMANAWKSLADTLGSGPLGGLGVLIDMSKNLATGLDSLVKHVPAIGLLISALMGFATITALFLGFKAAQSFVMAGFIGFQQAASRGVGAGLTLSGTMRQLAVTMLMAKGASSAQATAMVQQLGAMTALTRGTQMLTVSSQAASVNGFGAMTRGARTLGTSLLGFVGGPIGLVIGGLALLSGHLLSTAVEAEQAGKAIADGLAQGADAGMRAIGEVLKTKKVDLFTDGISGGSVGKTIAQVAEESGVGIDKMISSIAKGKDGVAAFNKVLDDFAMSKGYQSMQDMHDKNPFALASGDGQTAAKITFLKDQVAALAGENDKAGKTTDSVNKALSALGVPLEAVGDGTESATMDIDEMTKALKNLNDEIFGTINAEAALQGSMSKLGEGLQESNQFSPDSEGGRANLENLQDSLTKAREYYNQLKASDQITAQQAAQGYADFVEGLMAKIHALGGDTTAVDELANNTKARFSAIIGGGAPPKIPVDADGAPALAKVELTKTHIQQMAAANKPMLQIGIDDGSAQYQMQSLATSLAQLTGLPYQVVLDALTDPAHEKSAEVYAMLMSVTNGTYTAPVGADTSAAVTNVTNFSNWARTELANLQAQYNRLMTMAAGPKNNFFTGSANIALGKQWDGSGTQTYFGPGASAAAPAPAQVAAKAAPAPSIAAPNFGALDNGYNKAAQAASKAGDAGKKAGKDMADGINDATAAAEDYASRLKTALTSAFNQQYGLQKATDEYHSALNAITKKRDEEIAQLDELRLKVKQLNDERNKELITANKARIEANISAKYGETDRQADYEGQAQTALDNAAAKEKDIDATKKQSQELAAGIGNFNGYSDAAIENREALRNLESKMLDMITAYAATGASQEQVRAYAQRLTAQFVKDAGQVWNNRVTMSALTGEMNRYTNAINSVPRTKPTTVTADVNPALGEIGRLNGALNGLTTPKVIPVSLNTDAYNRKMASIQKQIVGGGMADDPSLTAFRPGTFAPVYTGGLISQAMQGFNEGGLIPGQSPADPTVDNLMAHVDGNGMIRVRSQEYIQSEPAVKYYGLDFMNALNALKLPKFSMGGSASGASSSSAGPTGPTVVQLTAENIAAIQRAGDRPVVLFADSVQLAKSVNDGNVILAQTGAN